MTRVARFDVVIVGASVAGCAAARLFGKAGARVALIDKRPAPDAHKVVCTHAILSSAAPTIERLGLDSLLEARGAVRILGDAWTPYGGWIPAPADAPRGWGVTRRTLDPLLRDLAAGTEGVELLLGRTATRLVTGIGGAPEGVVVETADHRTEVVRGRLVVGADGHNSTVAKLARIPGRVRPNNRFAYFAYWRGVRPRTDRARVWLLDPDGGAQFPNEDDLTVMVAVAHRSRLPAFRADHEGAYARMLGQLRDGPDLGQAERVSKLLGALDLKNVMRPAAGRGIAFVGDAALATDPIFGVGLTWAFQSAEWLADHAAPALLDGGDLDAALRRYRRAFARRVGPHHLLIADFSSGRAMSPMERAVSRAAAVDPRVAQAFEEVASRRCSPLRMLDPRFTARVAGATLRRGATRRPGRDGVLP
jgi:flavin-dependent dehydrogenase